MSITLEKAQERNRKYWSYLKGVFHNEISEDTPQFQGQPDGILSPLFRHQKTLLHAALDLESKKTTGIDCGSQKRLYTNVGILADRVGSGKSLVALSLVKQPPPEAREIVTKFRGTNLAMIKYQEPEQGRKRLRAALFVIPHNIMGQWENYVTSQTNLTAFFCRKKKEAMDKTFSKFFETADAIFVTSTMWKVFEEAQKPHQYHWSRIFIDEADTIQAPIKHAISTNFIWLISASYINMSFATGFSHNLNSPFYNLPPGEMDQSLIDTMKKIASGPVLTVRGLDTSSHWIISLLGGNTYDMLTNAEVESWRIILRNSDKFIDFSFHMPQIHHFQILCKSPANLRVLESMIPNEIMEMLHAGDTKGALQALGVHDESPTSVIASLTHTLRKELEQTKRKYEFSKTLDYSSESAKQKSLESQQAKIQSLEQRIETIEKRMADIDTINCPICYSDCEVPTMTPCCKNLFCFTCLCESLKRQAVCPLCRAQVTSMNQMHVVNKSSNAIVTPHEEGPKTKLDEFIQYVEKHPKAKILLFSEYDASFFTLTNEMERRGIKFSSINGSTGRISNIIQGFESGEYRVLFLNSRHMGAGLNIVAATDVFLFHKMTSEMEKQIIGRAYRIGRTEPLNVHHLLYQSEMK